MKTAAIIAEYNPFHNGHKFHIEKTKAHFDRIIVIMSGSFVQRGEPAVFSKWQRAETAVKNGADLVLELPFYYSVAASRDFALGAIKILDKLNTVDALSFGSESGDLFVISDAVYSENEAFSAAVRRYQKDGLSYPSAVAKASEDTALVLPNGPNDLLGREYLRALSDVKSSITPFTVKRTVPHDSDEKKDSFSSASALRKAMSSGIPISDYMPCQVSETPLFLSDLRQMLYLAVKNLDTSRYSVRSISDSELLNTVLSAAAEPELTSYLYNIKSKRYTMSRVKRTLMHILLNSGEKIPNFEPYARVLALNNNGRSIISDIKRNSDIKIITKLDKAYVKENPSLAMDIKASDIRSIALGERTGSDFLTSPKKI